MLKGINLSVNRGDTLGIVGDSRSDKTVLVRSVLGIGPSNCEVVEGSISFDGQDITALAREGLDKDPRDPHLDNLPGPDYVPEPAFFDRAANLGRHLRT
ncbi:hypothetical protein M0654_21015 [Rhizobium sp. NTR19]|uniref:ABC transporter domain-containing protein n=1 Tax=Neorhizobium turbinariae TaxID=2937795 RepID=A0ABT0IXJ6_9HYPH|nr:ATP-binding cassette domain-containing protein [Neorhizobium turbinariae]MCK8782461.1 hypothetical protein [Neorhizobium turbinariae]